MTVEGVDKPFLQILVTINFAVKNKTWTKTVRLTQSEAKKLVAGKERAERHVAARGNFDLYRLLVELSGNTYVVFTTVDNKCSVNIIDHWSWNESKYSGEEFTTGMFVPGTILEPFITCIQDLI